VLDKLFHGFGGRVQGGGILYAVVQASDFYTSDVEKRSPGGECKVVEGMAWCSSARSTRSLRAPRSTADFSAAQLKSDLQELGVKHHLLIVHTNQANALRTAYPEGSMTCSNPLGSNYSRICA
jgi:hypothetical protein